MKVTEKKSEKLKKQYEVSVGADKIEDKVNKKLKEYAPKMTLPGFRPGKTPKDLLKKKYADSLKGEILDDTVQEATQKVIEDNKLRPAMRPKIEILTFEDGKDLLFSIEVELIPEFKIAEFGSIKLEKLVVPVAEEEINKAIERLASSYHDSAPAPKSKAAEKGDITVIDFLGSVGGVPFKGGEGKDYHLELGSSTFIPGFEDQLIGKKTGETTDVKVTFPETYPSKDLAGKDAVFKVDVKEIRQKKPAEINDDFAKKFGKESIEALREMISEELKREYEHVARLNLKRELLDELASLHDFDIPEGMLAAEFDAIWKQIEDAKKNDSLDPEDKEKSDDELKDEYKSIAERRVRLGILLAEVGKEQNVQIDPADMNRALWNEARRYPGEETKVIEFYKKHPEMMDALKAPIFEEKVIDFILGKIELTSKEVSTEELYAAGEEAQKPSSAKKKKKTTKAKG